MKDWNLLKQLCTIPAPSGHEAPLRDFLLSYITKQQKKWKTKPTLIYGDPFQDCLLLKFGEPRTAIFAHMDTVGFTVRYNNQLVSIGSPHADVGTALIGKDGLGPILCTLNYDSDRHALYHFGRPIERGTALTYKVTFRESKGYIETAFLDNRLGIYNALKVAETLQNGIIAFSCWEEHGGGSVGYLADYIFKNWGVRQALISDITWVSEGVFPGKGVVISLRDQNIPRKIFVDKIISLAEKHRIPHQLEVEGIGSSDGEEIQRSPFPFDWCFVGAPEEMPHSPNEKVAKYDVDCMIKLYQVLMREL